MKIKVRKLQLYYRNANTMSACYPLLIEEVLSISTFGPLPLNVFRI